MFKKGFTLVELLIVISIIGVLAALSLVSFTAAQRQARDTQRKSDIAQYRNSLESFSGTTGGLYPSNTSTQPASSTLCGELNITNCPEDPKNKTDSSFYYKYISGGFGGGGNTATTYVLWAKLENVSAYWVVCSSGKSGLFSPISNWTDPTVDPSTRVVSCPI